MFNLKALRGSCLGILSSLMLLTAGPVAVAQSGDHAASGPFWHLRTDPATRSTLVQFYDQEHRLFYQEKLAQKYLKLNSRTTRVLDRTLDRLLQVHDKNMVATEIKSARLFASTSSAPELLEEKPPVIQWEEKMPNAPLAYRTVVKAAENSAKLTVQITNPERKKLYIRLEEETTGMIWGTVNLYYESTTLPRYLRSINLAGLKPGVYKLYILQPGNRNYYRVSVFEADKGVMVKVLNDKN